MKVAKYYRLLQKHSEGKNKGLFNVDGQKELLRDGVKVSQDYIDQTNASTPDTGLMYVIDEAATEARDKKLKGKQGEKAAAGKTEDDEPDTTNKQFLTKEKLVISKAETEDIEKFATKYNITFTDDEKKNKTAMRNALTAWSKLEAPAK